MVRWLWRKLNLVRHGMGQDRVHLASDPMRRAAQLREFSGLWIGVWEGDVVAAADTPDRLFRMLDDMGFPQAAVNRIPETRDVFVGLG